MGSPVLNLIAVIHFPKANGGILAGAGQYIAIEPPTHVADRAVVAAKTEIFAGRRRFPNEQAAAAIGRRQQHAIGAELNGVNPVGMLLDFKYHLTALGGEDADDFAWTAQGHHGMVIGNIRG